MASQSISESGVYSLQHLKSGHIYVGSSVDVPRRLKAHRSLLLRGKHHSIRLQRAWDKFGESEFIFSAIEMVADRELLLEREQYYIDSLGAFGVSGYNMLPKAGSTRGYLRPSPSKETLQKMRESQLGRKHDEATKAKISAANKGKKRSVEHCLHMAAINTGKKLSAETIAKRSAKIRGIKHPPYSEERRRNISESLKGRTSEKAMPVVVCGVWYRSVTDAVKSNGRSPRWFYGQLKKGLAHYANSQSNAI